MTHEQFLLKVRDAVAASQPKDVADRLRAVKLTYGIGNGTYRGVCYYQSWQNGTLTDFIEVAASGEESPLQLAGTTVHELGHVLAGPEGGHQRPWADACGVLGLRRARAAGQSYLWADFAPALRFALVALSTPKDGQPLFHVTGNGMGKFVGLPPLRIRPCPLGTGTRGGRSRGKGSGSRLRLYHCGCTPPVKVRAATDTLQATCKVCGQDFVRQASTKQTGAGAQATAPAPSEVQA